MPNPEKPRGGIRNGGFVLPRVPSRNKCDGGREAYVGIAVVYAGPGKSDWGVGGRGGA